MVAQKSLPSRLFDGFNILLMILISLAMVYPFYYMFIVSISGNTAVMTGSVNLLPVAPSFAAYQSILKDPMILVGFENSFLYMVVGTLINMVMTALCAYPLSRPDFFGRGIFIKLFVFTMFFNGGLIPLFLLVSNLGMINSIWAIVLPTAINVFYLVIMKSFFQSLPFALTESAYIDGANDIYIFWKIILPLSTPILATLILFYAVAQWNSFLPPLIFLTEKENYPIQLFVRNIVIEGQTADISNAMSQSQVESAAMSEKSIKYALIISAALPVMVIYPFIIRYFEKGVMIGSIKG
ncbi:carbohydrate ABC transporter permease [Paenibacillus sp. IB182496]|uniref:Carbohydrate ABC transporter permease n=1 Tax=Paenibacillus sabuli TaxID=2772509 RepID=A0A927GU77_9BACL|nr:carbohydrate ABC transporter permease [Paenibacillus sabuli]MBD2847427.1 carbohydrate ABC transporter permease [Paenibacillus sabuli]